MKVAFFAYPSAFQAPGGGEMQLLKTKKYLEVEGVEVKLFDQWNDKLEDFDVLHVFGSVKECLNLMVAAQAKGTKTVLSTICWYNWKSAWHIYPSLKGRTISVVRHLAKVLFPWVPSMRKRMMEHSDVLFPNSRTEADQLKRFFGVSGEKIQVIPNGVEVSFQDSKPDLFSNKYNLKDFVLCVGRIEPRKNQLNMIRALNNIDKPVVFIGDYVPQYKAYYEQCKKEAASNIHLLGPIAHDSELLASAYAACDTFVLVSWLETPGLAALEAGLAGAKIVITEEGATSEYFKNFATYVAPDKVAEIRSNVLKVIDQKKNGQLRNHIIENYTWDKVAQKTKEGYRLLLSSK